jgi:hypothetical protein
LRELTVEQVRELVVQPDELLAVWPNAMGERLAVIVPRHLERAGFRFVAEHDASGRLAGIAYGYRGAAGQWWHDLVSGAMDEAARVRWLAGEGPAALSGGRTLGSTALGAVGPRLVEHGAARIESLDHGEWAIGPDPTHPRDRHV